MTDLSFFTTIWLNLYAVWFSERLSPRQLSDPNGLVEKLLVTPDGKRVISIANNALLQLYGRGLVTKNLGNYEKAIVVFNKVIELKPEQHETWYNKACCYALQGNVELAIQNLKQADSLNPDTYKDIAQIDPAFDPIRQAEQFQAFMQGQALTPVESTSKPVKLISNNHLLANPNFLTVDATPSKLDHAIKVWDIETGKELFTFTGHTSSIHTLCVTPNGKWVISCSRDEHIENFKVWDIETGKELFTFTGKSSFTRIINYVSSDSKHFIYSVSGAIKGLNLETGEELFTLTGQVSENQAFYLTPDDKRLVYGSLNNTIKIFNLYSGQIVSSFTGESVISECGVAPDGVTIVAMEELGHLHILQLENLTDEDGPLPKEQNLSSVEDQLVPTISSKANLTIMLAEQEARRLGHDSLGTDHLLLGLIAEGTGVAAKALRAMGVTLKKARLIATKITGRQARKPSEEIIPFTPRCLELVQLAEQEAKQLDSVKIETEHLLLGLLRIEEGVATKILEELGLSPSQLRIQVQTLLQDQAITSVESTSNVIDAIQVKHGIESLEDV